MGKRCSTKAFVEICFDWKCFTKTLRAFVRMFLWEETIGDKKRKPLGDDKFVDKNIIHKVGF